jgi:hypothetical protein
MNARARLCLMGLALAAGCAAQQSNLFETKTTAVAVYTDGLSYFVREGTATPTNGWAMTNFLPTAVTGSLRVHPLDGNVRVDSLIATAQNDIPFTDEKSLKAALEPYIGVKVQLDWEGGSAAGKLEFLLPEMAILTEGKSSYAVRYEQVKKAQLLGYPLRMLFELPRGTRTVPLVMGYLQQGLSWQGSYQFDILSDNEADLAYRATVVNNAEDLVGAEMTFVLGSPSVALRGQVDPLSIHAGLAEGEIVAGARVRHAGAKGVAEDKLGAAEPEERAAAGFFVAGQPAGEGHANFSEFHFFRKKGVSLRKGDVGQIGIFSEKVAYRSDFEWDTSGEVWHFTRVRNESAEPWQPGPVLALRGGRSLGQGMMTFTPPGADATLAAAPVTDVKGKTAEREVERLPEQEFGRSIYVPVKLTGSLTIENLRATEIELKITHRVEGAHLEVSDGGVVEQVNLDTLNGKNTIVWKVKVPAKSTKTITYTFTRYVQAGTR